ncbi:MAG: transposase, partial [Thermotogae bacterium]|nr:transposase [Thermotogota bacterium]
LMKIRWKIEEVFRILKRVFSLDKFFVRTAEFMLGFFALEITNFSTDYDVWVEEPFIATLFSPFNAQLLYR